MALQQELDQVVVAAEDAAGGAMTHADRIFTAIETALITGEIPLGSRLGEEALARQYGVSRGPLREALLRLEGRGLVERLPHAGARVVRMDQADLLELYEIREPLEGMACRLAAQRRTEADVEALRRALQLHGGPDVPAGAGRRLLDFHFLIARASRSRRLEQMLCQDLYFLIRLCRRRAALIAPRDDAAAKEHQRILEAIEERDGELAELLMRRHVAATRRHLSQQDLGATALV